jgi:hypothetical protein
MRVKFDNLKSARNVPIHSADGWHLTTEPVTDKNLLNILRGGMEQSDEVGRLVEEMNRRARG